MAGRGQDIAQPEGGAPAEDPAQAASGAQDQRKRPVVGQGGRPGSLGKRPAVAVPLKDAEQPTASEDMDMGMEPTTTAKRIVPAAAVRGQSSRRSSALPAAAVSAAAAAAAPAGPYPSVSIPAQVVLLHQQLEIFKQYAGDPKSPISQSELARAEKLLGKKLDYQDSAGKLYQRDAFLDAVMLNKDQILILPTGSGKTEIALAIALSTLGVVTVVFPLSTLKNEVNDRRLNPILDENKETLDAAGFRHVCLTEQVMSDPGKRAEAIELIRGACDVGGDRRTTLVVAGPEQLRHPEIVALFAQLSLAGLLSRIIIDEVHLAETQGGFRDACMTMLQVGQQQQRIHYATASVPCPRMTLMSATIPENMIERLMNSSGMHARNTVVVTSPKGVVRSGIGLWVLPYSKHNTLKQMCDMIIKRADDFDARLGIKGIYACILIWVAKAGAVGGTAQGTAKAWLTKIVGKIGKLLGDAGRSKDTKRMTKGATITGQLLGDLGKQDTLLNAATGITKIITATSALSAGSDVSSHTSFHIDFEGIITMYQMFGRMARGKFAADWHARAFIYIRQSQFYAACKRSLLDATAARRAAANLDETTEDHLHAVATADLIDGGFQDLLDSWAFQHTWGCRWVWLHQHFKRAGAGPSKPCVDQCDNCVAVNSTNQAVFTRHTLGVGTPADRHVRAVLATVGDDGGDYEALAERLHEGTNLSSADGDAIVSELVATGVLRPTLAQCTWQNESSQATEKREKSELKNKTSDVLVVERSVSASRGKGGTKQICVKGNCKVVLKKVRVVPTEITFRLKNNKQIKLASFALSKPKPPENPEI
eukprot:m.162932 g.162932  ORF g.162932 m.162932 type:complete len:822 (-) comp23893_c0_seq5:2382-4847(-)